MLSELYASVHTNRILEERGLNGEIGFLLAIKLPLRHYLTLRLISASCLYNASKYTFCRFQHEQPISYSPSKIQERSPVCRPEGQEVPLKVIKIIMVTMINITTVKSRVLTILLSPLPLAASAEGILSGFQVTTKERKYPHHFPHNLIQLHYALCTSTDSAFFVFMLIDFTTSRNLAYNHTSIHTPVGKLVLNTIQSHSRSRISSDIHEPPFTTYWLVLPWKDNAAILLASLVVAGDRSFEWFSNDFFRN